MFLGSRTCEGYDRYKVVVNNARFPSGRVRVVTSVRRETRTPQRVINPGSEQGEPSTTHETDRVVIAPGSAGGHLSASLCAFTRTARPLVMDCASATQHMRQRELAARICS